MSSPTEGYAPRDPDYVDNIRYTERVVDQILRNNPLVNAVVSRGLARWIGNYISGPGPDKINFLWIGEFFPADTNLGPAVAQRGFSLVRDDSRGGRSAIAMFDPTPAGGGGLKQCLFISSGDGRILFQESRDGGWNWPQDNVWMGALDASLLNWTQTPSGTFETIFEGRANIVGNRIFYRMFAATTNGATAEFRLRVEGFGGDVIGPTHSMGVNTSGVFDDSVDVSASRATTVTIRWEARRTNGVGEARTQCISVRCYTP
ncbi:MAG TPA: hypothetical protein VJ769_09515 [Actinomycetes bacterium]|nr:hypothetical protein [Actinomycetes bacterium]